MTSKSHVHAARSSPIPGIVVIILAVAAVLFGLAVVQKPRASHDMLQVELIRLRAMLEALHERTTALERRVQQADERPR
jgi:BMFP domain-containing protein YqiC